MGLETVFLTLALLVHGVRSHGRLMEPPSRSSMWRVGFDVPKNYDDNRLNCGGMQYQWVRNGGRCGLCGDPVDGPRPNEAGGSFATGTISRSYDCGQQINISVEITSAQKGWFEFRLCPNNDPSRRITSECLNEHLLEKADGTSRHEGVPGGATEGAGFIYMQYILPANLICSQCVLQWKYHTGKDWGCDSTGCGVGKGIQEEFYGCSDIAIRSTTATKSPQGGTNALDNDVTSCQGRGILGNTCMDSRCRQLCPLGQCSLVFCNDACHRLAPTN